MRCPYCGFENPEGLKFCGGCAVSLGSRCPTCGFENPPRFKFCGECATPLQSPSPTTISPTISPPRVPMSYTPQYLAEKILTSKSAMEGERKLMTVLFADVKGSLELLADRDPEEARQLLDPVIERLMEAVHRYDGTVNQVMGDGIMALFGAPIAHEDHAVRGCYAALAMQEAVGRYADELQRRQELTVQIRVGLNSGEVVVRSIGSDLRMDYTAVGQTTHLAARMEQIARPGSVLITGITRMFAADAMQVNPLGPLPIKGLAEPMEVFELVGVGPARTRFVIQNLHWIDAETQAVLDSLIDSLPAARMLLLVNYRPEYQHGWGSRTYYTQLSLEPLSHEKARELLDALLGEDPWLQSLKRRLVDRTQGNAFFLEESIRTLVETQVLVGEQGGYRLAKTPPEHTGAGHRAGGASGPHRPLAPEEKRLLQTAKAMVRSAYREAVAYFEQALEAVLQESYETQEQAIDLRLNLRNVLLPLGEQGRIFEHLRVAATVAEVLQDQHRLGWVAQNQPVPSSTQPSSCTGPWR
jgi:class 3 adenylate cyclase